MLHNDYHFQYKMRRITLGSPGNQRELSKTDYVDSEGKKELGFIGEVKAPKTTTRRGWFAML